MCEGLGIKVRGFKLQGTLRGSWDLVIGAISQVTRRRIVLKPESYF